MTIRTLARFLFTGDAESIRAIAASRGALWLGLVFVLSAGLAREYDGEYLPAKPWVLAIPFAASISLSLMVFSIFWIIARRPVNLRRPPFWSGYRMFATVFLMTAPLAWLYSIPYERFLSPVDATSANLWTLALVAFWRVVLTVQIVRNLVGVGPISTVPVLLTVACAGVLIALAITPTPIFDVMGGIRYTPRDRMLASTGFLAGILSILSLPFCAIAAVTLLRLANADWPIQRISKTPLPITAPLIVLACVSIAIWLPILPFTQAEQRLRYQVDRQVAARHFAEAVAIMSAHAQRDFPPAWDPPPRFGRPGERESDVVEMVAAMLEHPVTRWVADLYCDKFTAYGRSFGLHWMLEDIHSESEILSRFKDTLHRLPVGEPWDALHREFDDQSPGTTQAATRKTEN